MARTQRPDDAASPHHPHHPIFARFYRVASAGMERTGYARYRDELLAGLTGRVVEVGCGNGLNFGHYPPEVTEVVGVEPEPYLRARAVEAAAGAPIPVRVVDGVVEDLPADDGEFDAGVASLVLCSVTDPDGALAELHRVVRPDGELRFFEHVRARTDRLARVQRAADATLWPRLAGGCHTHRDTVAAIERAGFAVTELRRFREPDSRVPLPVSPHVLGRATRPA